MKVDELLPHMRDVVRCEASLRELNLVWRVIEINARMNCPQESQRLLPMMAATRSGFEELQNELVASLADQKVANVTAALHTRAQHVIDVIVRNLFERTADVGFLATDRTLCEYLAGTGGQRPAVVERLRAYRDKYTVYDEILLLDLDGRVMANIDGAPSTQRHDDPLIAQTLAQDGYLETFRVTALRPDGRPALIYSQRMLHPTTNQPVGLLCLVFGFESEMAGIFSAREPGDRSIGLLLDSGDRVIASSDESWIARGVRVNPVHDWQRTLCSQGGIEYLVQVAQSAGYEGYPGPAGWKARVMVPVASAFGTHGGHERQRPDGALAEGLLTHADRFCPPLQEILDAAHTIRRVVWNGQVMTADEAGGGQALKTVLEQITETGARSDEVFKRSIDDLFEAALASNRAGAEALTSLLVELIDRNLYERANDCRWWALTPELRATLAEAPADRAALDAVDAILEHINGLYTVYARLVVYDRAGTIVAASRPQLSDGSSAIGAAIEADSLAAVLALPTPQHYHATPFRGSELYDGRPTYVYHAAIRAPHDDGEIVGGIGIVFDSEPQFAAMLRGSLEGVPADCQALFLDSTGRVMSGSDAGVPPGSPFALPAGLAEAIAAPKSSASVSRIVAHDGQYVVAAAAASLGYREFKTSDGYRDDILAVFLQPLGNVVEAGRPVPSPLRDVVATVGAQGFATFFTEVGLFALPVGHVVEALPGVDVRPVSLGASEHRVGLVARRRDEAVQGYVWVYDLNAMLGGSRQARPEACEVLIFRHGTDEVGFLVGNLHAVPSFEERQIVPAAPFGGQGRHSLVSHLIRANAGELLIQVLDPQRLIASIGSPHDDEWPAAGEAGMPAAPATGEIPASDLRG